MIGLLAVAAHAGTLGIGVGGALDLPDPGSGELRTTFGPAAELVVPYRFDPSPGTSIRIQGHGTFAKGTDLLSWTFPGQSRSATEPVSTYAGQLGISVGPEIRFTRDPDRKVVPYLGGDLGLSVVGNWHTNMQRPELFDPAYYTVEDLDNSRTTSPFTRQVAPETSLELGLHAGRLWTELGYETMFLGAHPLRHGTPSLQPHREAYGWNAFRLTIGVDLGSSRPAPPG